ncbi:MAG: hypothetical protein R3F20_19780 [Planctomycetota bacterium]
MTKKKAALLVVLTILCAYVNRGLVLSAFAEETNEVDDELADPGGEELRVDDDVPSAEPRIAEAMLPRPVTDLRAEREAGTEAPEISALRRISGDEADNALILASLSRRIIERSRLDSGARPRDPFEEVSRNGDPTADSAGAAIEEDRDRAAVETARAEELARAAAEAEEARQRAERRAAIAGLKVHAIMRSRDRAVARIGDRNLREGDPVPGTTAVIERVEARRVLIRHEGETIVIELSHGSKIRLPRREEAEAAPREAQVTPAPIVSPLGQTTEGASK